MTTVLVTGMGGFIGSHMMDHLLVHTDWQIVGLDSFRHKGLTDRITDSAHYRAAPDRVRVLTHDLLAPLSRLLIDDIGEVDAILNIASDSHVDRSIEHPVAFVQNNVALALNVMEYARAVKPKVVIQVSTDEVYGPMLDHPHQEWESIIPSNPYSASKAAQEAIAVSYWRTYGVPVVITNTMNNFGERQDPEKFLPRIIRAVMGCDMLTIHGTPQDIGSRYWLHARNHADALLRLLHQRPAPFGEAERPDRYHIVGQRLTNVAFAEQVAHIMGRPLRYELVDFHSARPGHDPHYGLDGGKMTALGWTAPRDLASSLAQTVYWYEEHPAWLTL